MKKKNKKKIPGMIAKRHVSWLTTEIPVINQQWDYKKKIKKKNKKIPGMIAKRHMSWMTTEIPVINQQ